MNLSKILKIILKSVVVITLLVTLGYYLLVVRNPLPSDEEMIQHFNAHRAEIEELVRRYRIFDPDPKVSHSTTWYKDTKEMMRRVGLYNISFSAFEPWLPNPYTLETARLVSEKSKTEKKL